MASTTSSSKVVGTPAYMAPERFGRFPGDARSDLYSLGCLLHELLTGHPPFRAGDLVATMAAHLYEPPTPPSCIRPGIPAALEDLVLDLLAKDPEQRPASAAEVHHRLRELPHTATGSATSTHPPSAGTGPATVSPAAQTTVPRAHTPHEHPTTTAPAPARVSGSDSTRRRISRRTALRLGIAAIAAAGAPAALALFHRKSPATLDAPLLRWQQATAEVATPVVVGGVVYTSGGGGAQALDATTGATKWTTQVTDRPMYTSVAAVADEAVYIGSGDGVLYALDAATGARKWVQGLGDSIVLLTVDTGILYVIEEHILHALDPATGATKWTLRSPSDPRFITPPKVAGGVLYIGGADQHIYALDATTRATLWTCPTGNQYNSISPVVNGTVYVGSYDGYLYALDARTGARRWAFGTGEPVLGLAVAAGTVYFGSDKLYAADALTGAKRWVFTADDLSYGSPTVAEGVVYTNGYYGPVYAVDATTGAGLWAAFRNSNDRHRTTPPTVANGLVYVGSNGQTSGGSVYAFDAATSSSVK